MSSKYSRLQPPTGKSLAFQRGFEEAERQYMQNPDDVHRAASLINPFRRDSEEWMGFEESLYILTLK